MTAAKAKEYHADKEKVAQKIQAQNALESYTYNLHSIVQVSSWSIAKFLSD